MDDVSREGDHLPWGHHVAAHLVKLTGLGLVKPKRREREREIGRERER